MSDKNLSDTPVTRYESLCDFNLLSLWSLSSSDWSSIVNEEIQATTNQPLEEKESNLTNKVVLFGALMTLALLGVATWIQAQEIIQIVGKTGESKFDSFAETPPQEECWLLALNDYRCADVDIGVEFMEVIASQPQTPITCSQSN